MDWVLHKNDSEQFNPIPPPFPLLPPRSIYVEKLAET